MSRPRCPHESARLCAAYSSGDDEDAYVDADGLCPAWSFTFCDPNGQYLDLVLVGDAHRPVGSNVTS